MLLKKKNVLMCNPQSTTSFDTISYFEYSSLFHDNFLSKFNYQEFLYSLK